MHDLLIKNARIVDGTGRPAFQGDVAVEDGRIVAVGGNGVVSLGAAQRSIDADGALLTPGWVDVHTHYDGQATWDPYLSPSSNHGVTTAVMGNCGVGFAPVKPDKRDWLISVMEGVEDIPGSVLSEGIQWEWESFPEYLDALERRESCGGHFREEFQEVDGEAKRDDENFAHVAAWEFTGVGQRPNLHKEQLTFDYVKPSQRSYK
jgi:N-acyl-D-aspartate/D-glutamate deacylase